MRGGRERGWASWRFPFFEPSQGVPGGLVRFVLFSFLFGGAELGQDRLEGRRRGGLDGDAVAGGQGEVEGLGVEHEPGEADLAGLFAVAEIAEDGVADVVEVDADLVAAARRGLDAEQGRAVEALGGLPVGRGRLAAGRVDAHPAGAELAERGVDLAAVRGGDAVDEGEVGLADLAAVELGVEVAVGGGVLGEDDDAARAAVEAVDGEELVGEAGAEEVGQAGLAGLGDGEDALGLVGGQKVVVLPENGDGGGIGTRSSREGPVISS